MKKRYCGHAEADCIWPYCSCAEAMVERLRKALREIDDIAIQHVKGGIGKAQQIARRALTEG